MVRSADAATPHDVLHWYVDGGANAQWAVRQGDWKLIGNVRTATNDHVTEADRRLFLSNLAVLFFSYLYGDQFLNGYGWRIPFALSIVLVAVGLWIRLGILETPVFQQLVSKNKIEKAPVLEVVAKQPREIILSALLRMSEQAPFYIFTAFVFAYAVGTLKMNRDFILTAVLAASCVSFITIPL